MFINGIDNMATNTKKKKYSPALGQAMLGNKWERFDADFTYHALYKLSEQLAKLNPENQAHGLLGGEYGYGQEFSNDVFEMHPYYWGECECGFEKRWNKEYEKFHQLSKHSMGCYQNAYRNITEKYHFIRHKEKHDAAVKALCEKHKVSYPEGSAVHCTCGYEGMFEKWNKTMGDHDPSCRIVLANFVYKEPGKELLIFWYKYMGRGMSMNRELSQDQWYRIIKRCKDSLNEKEQKT